MIALRSKLNDMGISWEDVSIIAEECPSCNIYRTRFVYNKHIISVISGTGTKGGIFGLLELTIDTGEPTGDLTASGTIEIVTKTCTAA